MAFDIRVVSERADEPADPVGRGRICIGSFEEEFEMVFEYWTPAQYKRQWREGVRRIVDNRPTSCLLTSIGDPTTANFFFWWPIYRVYDRICVQNQMLFLDDLEESFDLSDPYRSVRARETVSEDGSRISEWQTTIADLRGWLDAN